jgi:hypothetical protein
MLKQRFFEREFVARMEREFISNFKQLSEPLHEGCGLRRSWRKNTFRHRLMQLTARRILPRQPCVNLCFIAVEIFKAL